MLYLPLMDQSNGGGHLMTLRQPTSLVIDQSTLFHKD